VTLQWNGSPKTMDLLDGRLELVDNRLVKQTLAFRHYLRVRTVLSGQALAIERLRWAERYYTPLPMAVMYPIL